MRDANGQQLAYVYFENEPGRRSAARLLSKDEARRIAANIAKLPELPLWALRSRIVGVTQQSRRQVSVAVGGLASSPLFREMTKRRFPPPWSVAPGVVCEQRLTKTCSFLKTRVDGI